MPDEVPKPAYAKGLEGVIANESALSDVRGDEGKLFYLGYGIDDLVNLCNYEEVCYLLLNKKLPNRTQLAEFTQYLRSQRELPQPVIDWIKTCPKDAAPMDILRTGVSMLGIYDAVARTATRTEADNQAIAVSLIARVPVIVAYFHAMRRGRDLLPVRTDLSEAAHFLYLLKGRETTKAMEDTLNCAYILHADHGMNASTFAARVCVGTLSDMYSGITAAVGTLKGALHGGANEGVIKMLKEIGDEGNVDPYITAKLGRKEKIMGIGHRVYRTLDPRAPHLRRMAIRLTEDLGEPKWILMSERIAQIMYERKKLQANVDFYSATVYFSMGIPSDLFTPIFAIARTAGWVAQMMEQLADNKLYRPLTLYTGPSGYVPVLPIDMR